ncbi:hypothetical protein Q664_16880 [Archangium violaceum Cb vi76]|uniref:DUF378 domain-containing protein n=1 Tax=Archangium violaceum Cb vi76 TaxID=1406225 RepID=A0A084SUS6_9BACT|nr:hypothetical protein Q664_16880 [Archangium violaceum Cb vi76]
MSTFTKMLAVLVILGAITWGLIGLFQWNLVAAVLGGDVRPTEASHLSQLVYILVGLAGVAFAFTFPWRSRPAGRREVHP